MYLRNLQSIKRERQLSKFTNKSIHNIKVPLKEQFLRDMKVKKAE